MSVAFLYSGQGSHYYQMGRDLFERRGAFYRYAIELDDLLTEYLGASVVETIYDPRHKISTLFDETLFTHSAIFLIECALSQALISEGLEPDCVLAASMGAFAALVVAGSLDIEQAARAVVTQAKLIDRTCVPGGMLALPSMQAQQAEVIARRHGCAIGSAGKTTTVLCADQVRLEAVETELKQRGIAFQKLAVSRAFHSAWIDAAQVEYQDFLASIPLRQPRLPIACCVEGRVRRDLPSSYLWDVVRLPLRLDEAAHDLCRDEPVRCIDVGPSGTLATSLKYLLPDQGSPHQIELILSPFGGEAQRYDRMAGAWKAPP